MLWVDLIFGAKTSSQTDKRVKLENLYSSGMLGLDPEKKSAKLKIGTVALLNVLNNILKFLRPPTAASWNSRPGNLEFLEMCA